MPYSKGSVPDRLKDKGIPQRFINQWIEVFNSVLDKTGDEGKAFERAYGVMNKALLKAGYRKGQDGKWHKTSRREGDEADYLSEASMRPGVMIEEGKSLEQALVAGLSFEGVALVDHTFSQQESDIPRYYSPEYNDHVLKRTNEFMKLGHTLKMYANHASAMGGAFSLGGEKLPVGIIPSLRRVEDEIRYKGHITPTTEGQDVIRLMFDGAMGESSVRVYDYNGEMVELEDKDGKGTGEYMMVLKDGYIGGIDFCDHAGVPGAGVVRVLESWHEAEIDPQEKMPSEQDQGDEMYEKMTVEELRKERPDLINQLIAEQVGVFADMVTTLQAQLKEAQEKPAEPDTAMVAEIADLKTKLEAMATEIVGLRRTVKIHEAAQGPIGKEIVSKILVMEVTEDKLIETAEGLRDTAIAAVLAESPRDSAKGKTSFESDSDVGDEKKVVVEDTEMVGDMAEVEKIFRMTQALDRNLRE